jgi:nucleoside-diphosphate-sugar epimerase
MRVLVASGDTSDELIGEGHERQRFEGDVRDHEAMGAALAGKEALILVVPRESGTGWRAEFELLDRATRGTYVALNAAIKAGVKRVVLVSTLALLERYPAQWKVDDGWRPVPDVERPEQLAAYLAEESAKELTRAEPIQVVCVRLGAVDASARREAIAAALTDTLTRHENHSTGRVTHGWWVRHAGERIARDGVAGAVGAVPSRPIRSVAVFGAGGPLAAAAQPLLSDSYRLRLTDLRPLNEITNEAKPQSPGAPLPLPVEPPHEARQVDVTDYDQVLEALGGMDAATNCTVVRPHPVLAFHVNTLGAYHVMKAAVAQGIRRVVHTGPLLVLADQPGGYAWDFGVPDEAPPRPGNWIYLHSKYLGQEIVRLFAERYQLEAPTLLFCNFVNPEVPRRRNGVGPFTVSWADAGAALRCALEVESLPRPFEPLHVLADLPHAKYSNARAKQLLGWQPQDTLEALYTTGSAG